MKNFVLIGASGYIAPRHIEAIKITENNLLASIDLQSESKDIKDNFPEAKFFLEFDLFDTYVSENKKEIDFVVICSPNHLHFEHSCWALKYGLDVICEKPLSLNYYELDSLKQLEKIYDAKIWTILQLRLHKTIQDLKQKSLNSEIDIQDSVELTYVTPRNQDYLKTWKGDESKSGGILVNIGLHFFDMLLYLFGEVKSNELHKKDAEVKSGIIHFEDISVIWFLSILEKHSPKYKSKDANLSYRSITINKKELDFSGGFENLHVLAYRDILEGKGFGIDQNRGVMKLLEDINRKEITKPDNIYHPFLKIV